MTRLSCIVTIISIALMCVVAQDLYTDKFDDVDVEGILANDKLRTEYYRCIMETSPCITADAKFLKEVFGEALNNKCKRCTEKQKAHMDSISTWYTKNKPDEWQAIVEKAIEDLKKKNAGQ